jgi:hypothetical protein
MLLSLFIFGIGKNSLVSGRSPLLYESTKGLTKLTVIIIVGYHCFQLHTKVYQYPPLKLKSVYRSNYW